MESIQKTTIFQTLEERSAPLFDRKAYEETRIQWLNETEGDLPGPPCPLCRNKGYIAKLRPEEEGGNMVLVPCSCRKVRRSVQKMEQSGLKNFIQQCTFAKFHAAEPWQKTIRDTAEAYSRASSGWLVMLGQSGNGKTHLCTAVCRELLLQGCQVLYSPWREDSMRIKTAPPEMREALMQERKEAEVLYIDDLFKSGKGMDGALFPTSADINLAFEILNYRYIQGLRTILSSEFHTDDLLEIDEALASRILEMAGKNLCVICRDRKRNYRLRSLQNAGS